MSGFYVSLIFIGILLIIFSLVAIFLDKKKAFGFIRNYDAKKQELIEIINDAEQMIEELNRLSDYIVNQMDLKNEELNKNIKAAEDKIKCLSKGAGLLVEQAETERISVIDSAIEERTSAAAGITAKASQVSAAAGRASYGRAAAMAKSAVASYLGNDQETASKQVSKHGITIGKTPVVSGDETVALDEHGKRPNTVRFNEKVIPIGGKYAEIARLSQEGLHSQEIAKKLNMGKGEVELFLNLRK